MRDSFTAHDVQAPARYVTPARPAPGDVLPTLHTWELSTFLQHRDAIVTTARDTVDRHGVDIDGDTLDTVAVMRSLVLRIHGEADRLARHAHVHDEHTGDQDETTPAPDGFERVRAQTRTERTNKGESVQLVTVHGRGAVQGDLSVSYGVGRSTSIAGGHPWMTVGATVAARNVIDECRRATFGVDGVDLARATSILWSPDTLPRLVGGDVLSWHTFESWDETRARTPRRGWSTRRRLATLTPRRGEVPAPRSTFAEWTPSDVPEWTPVTVSELLAPTGDDATAWVGHRLTVRPDTVRDQRAKSTKRVDEALVIRDGDDLAVVLSEVAATAPAGYRATWQQGEESGALTVSGDDRKRRYSLTGFARPIRGQRTPAALARAIARAQADTL